jgi:hypothetical protein
MTTLEAEQILLRQWRSLPPDKQKEALKYVESLQPAPPTVPFKTSRGLWRDLGVNITEHDISEARDETWSSFPRDIHT